MDIIVGKTAGFCYGVKRAVDGAIEELKKNNNINCLGELVHNKQVIDNLKEKGFNFIDKIEDSTGATIIRAHGITKNVYEYANKNNIIIKDYTCPNVLKIHEIAENYSKEGYCIFICGSSNHPETIGTISYCGEKFFVIEKEEDIEDALSIFNNNNYTKLLLLAQTTYSLQKFEIITEKLKEKLPKNIELIVKNTICKATELRQRETEKISKEVDYMIIIGGKNSSNTKKLYEISIQNCKNSICIETAEELNKENLKKYGKIGIMAGASTPQESIDNVINELLNI